MSSAERSDCAPLSTNSTLSVANRTTARESQPVWSKVAVEVVAAPGNGPQVRRTGSITLRAWRAPLLVAEQHRQGDEIAL